MQAPQRIKWARSFSTSMGSERALREGTRLISLEEAREQQQDILNGRDSLELVTRLTARLYSAAQSGVELTPLLFVEQSFEGAVLPNRKTRMALTFGFTSIRDSLEGWSAGGHLARLLFADTPHLVSPDLYWFIGFNYVRLRGPGAAPFGSALFSSDTTDNFDLPNTSTEPKASLVNYRLGFETHIKYRFGATAFIEYAPLLKESLTIATKKVLGIPYQSYGMGVVIRW